MIVTASTSTDQLVPWKRQLVAQRRSRHLTADQFREIWDATCCGAARGLPSLLRRLARHAKARPNPGASEGVGRIS